MKHSSLILLGTVLFVLASMGAVAVSEAAPAKKKTTTQQEYLVVTMETVLVSGVQ